MNPNDPTSRPPGSSPENPDDFPGATEYRPTHPSPPPQGPAHPAGILARSEPEITGSLDTKKVFDALLRSPRGLINRFAKPGHGATRSLIAILIGSMIAYGLVLGSFAMGQQLWAAPLKIALGLLVSAVICFPSLYIFFCLSGSKISVGQLAASLIAMLALGGLLLVGFAPAVWIFTQATNSYGFMGFLALAPWFIALFFGLRFLLHAARETGAAHTGPIALWLGIFTLVTLQMATSLRPILGVSNKFLTGEKMFFLENWGTSIEKELPKQTSSANTDPGEKPKDTRSDMD